MALKFVDELPVSAKKPTGSTSKVFTEDLAEELRDNPGKWALIEGGSGQGAAAWVKRTTDAGMTGFEYQSIDTGKPEGEKRKVPNGEGEYQPTKKEIYVRFNPDKA